jgi:hypothetical protein
MQKKKPVVMWALWNFGRVMGVKHTRKAAKEYAAYLHPDPGGASVMFKSGAFRISKVAVREI